MVKALYQKKLKRMHASMCLAVKPEPDIEGTKNKNSRKQL